MPGEEELSENEAQLRFAANAVPALLSYIDAGARYVWCNESYRRWFGYAPETLRGRHVSEVLGPTAWAQLRPHVERALGGEMVTFEDRIPYKNGPVRDIRASYIPHVDSGGRVRGFVVLSNDVTAIKAAERALRRSESMLERSQSTAHVGSYEVMMADANGVRAGTVWWSDETYRMFGFEPGTVEATPAGFYALVHPEDRERMRNTRPNMLQRGEAFENEFRVVRPDGTVRHMHTWTDFERDLSGTVIRMFGTCQDITERKIAERELREANRHKDEFLAMLSHELRNPLAPILNAIEIIERVGPNDEPLRSAYQAVIARQVQHMKRLLDDLLDVSRVSQGKIELRKQNVELAGLLMQAVEVSRPLMLEKHQQLTMTLAHEPMPLEADPTRIVQVFANLVNNAAKFTDAGGHITLMASVQDGHAVVSVRDDGTGMSSDLIPHAFDLFVQEKRSSDRAQGGLGIGLTLVRTLVKMHGGYVTAISEGPGRGSEFVVRLPLAPAVAAVEWVAPPAPRNGQTTPLRVLVVDDNVDAADALQYVLKLSGHQVTVAYDGPGAIAAAATARPELVLLDIGLPGMDGYQVAERLRQAGHDRAALIAISGYGQEEDLSRSRGAGFHHHLVKPVDGATLKKLIAELSSR
ncbi:MAG TPA: PAS domain-containing protein [Polyangia bacterium]|nr:PAS domain-containing protein [Polyangia bacterium]